MCLYKTKTFSSNLNRTILSLRTFRKEEEEEEEVNFGTSLTKTCVCVCDFYSLSLLLIN
jgi:hypothetical protein